jgi:hypothetical protein
VLRGGFLLLMSADRTRELASLLCAGAERDVHTCVEELLAKHGCARPEPGADDESDMRHALYWILRNAERTHRHLEAADREDRSEIADRFRALVQARPAREREHAQLHIDAASSLRRAAAIKTHLDAHPGPCLAVGDDDAITLALALMGVRDLHAVDIDPRILEFLSASASSIGARIDVARVDVLNEPVPAHLHRRASAVLADPIRSLEPTLSFLLFGAAAMERERGKLFWADDPDWSFEHAEVVLALETAGLSVELVREDMHAYPLDLEAIDSARVARELSIDPAWLEAIVTRTFAWSNLYAISSRGGRRSSSSAT